MKKNNHLRILIIAYMIVAFLTGVIVGANMKPCYEATTSATQERERLIFIKQNNEIAYKNGWITKKELLEYQNSLDEQLAKLEKQ